MRNNSSNVKFGRKEDVISPNMAALIITMCGYESISPKAAMKFNTAHKTKYSASELKEMGYREYPLTSEDAFTAVYSDYRNRGETELIAGNDNAAEKDFQLSYTL